MKICACVQEVSNVCGSGSKLEEIKQLTLNQSPDTVMVTCVSCDSELLDVKRVCCIFTYL